MLCEMLFMADAFMQVWAADCDMVVMNWLELFNGSTKKL